MRLNSHMFTDDQGITEDEVYTRVHCTALITDKIDA